MELPRVFGSATFVFVNSQRGNIHELGNIVLSFSRVLTPPCAPIPAVIQKDYNYSFNRPQLRERACNSYR